MERFQDRTLQSICILQNPLILQTVARYLQKHTSDFRQMDRAGREAAVRTLLETKGRVQHTPVGPVVGHFTEEEYAFYLDHERTVRRRLVTLLVQRVLDQLEALPS